jgi:integrase
LAIHREDIDWDRCWLTVPVTKNGVPRVVPLTDSALTVLNRYPSKDRLFAIAPDSVTQAFSRACRRAGINDLRFHDLRHEAISRLFEQGRSVPEVASISGHSDYRMLARYTHLQPASQTKPRAQKTNWPN